MKNSMKIIYVLFVFLAITSIANRASLNKLPRDKSGASAPIPLIEEIVEIQGGVIEVVTKLHTQVNYLMSKVDPNEFDAYTSGKSNNDR